YARAGWPMRGAFDVSAAAARATARRFGLACVHGTFDEALAQRDVVFDVAVPADQVLGIVRRLPRGAVVLIQKPLGRAPAEARRTRAPSRARELVAAVNFQLRFAPGALALSDAIARGRLGVLREVEVRVVTHTPWTNWTFLRGIPRLEILYHSIHYLD